ncbi:MAG TPA: hypothetical protein VL371_03965 [Gemmataceae bacterium]|jgi:hypothetical protein|nr:hypothetical protein [Gemmataceae bacterium]
MQNTDWIELFHLIPPEQQNILVLTTVGGIDLNIEVILRTEPSVLVFRGRVQGSTDDGRVFFLPYRQIDFLQMNRFVRENEIQEMFSKAAPPQPAAEKPPERPSRVFASVASPHSSAIYSSTGEAPPGSPRAVPAPAVRLSGSQLGRLQTSMLVPEGTVGDAENGQPGEVPAPPRSSILERLRAQRNAVMPPQPPPR